MSTTQRSIIGTLEMADFAKGAAHCRVRPASGDPVTFLFDDELSDRVLRCLRRVVRISSVSLRGKRGVADPARRISAIEPVEGKLSELHTASEQFRRSPSLRELMESQGVSSETEWDKLVGGWPGDVDDGFEEAVLRWRHEQTAGQQQ